jgi:uncharacterized membrane protein required for colicin V production
MTIVISSLQALLVPVMIIFAILGWRRGFYREVGTAAGLAIGLFLTTIAGQGLVGFVNRLITLGPRILNQLLGRGDVGITLEAPIPEDALDPRNWLFRVVVFIVIAVLTYTVMFPWERDPKSGRYRLPGNNLWEKVLGGVFGAAVGFLWLGAVQSFANELAAIQNRPALLQGGAAINVPTLGVDAILSFLPTIAVLAVVVLIILILFRIPKIWS